MGGAFFVARICTSGLREAFRQQLLTEPGLIFSEQGVAYENGVLDGALDRDTGFPGMRE
jgi:hypothetical protein